MARTGFLLALAFCGLALACGQGDDSATLPRQVDIQGLTFEGVRLQAVAALSRPGEVYHEVGTRKAAGGGSGGFTTEAWLDMERDVARVLEAEERLRIFHDDKVAELGPNGRFYDVDFWPASELAKKAVLSLEHMTALFDTDIESTTIEAAEIEGVPAILVEVTDPYQGDYSGTQQRKIYLDESFLPMRIDDHADIDGMADQDWSTTVQHEFIDPASLPGDFFSPEAVREHEVTPIDDIARAHEFGLEPYWLGEHFEEMALEEAMLYDDEDAGQWLVLTYHGGVMGPESPGFGVIINQYTNEGWERRLAHIADTGRTPWWEQPTVIKTTVIVQGNEATLYEGPSRLPPATVERQGETPPTAESEGQPPRRTVVPVGTGSSWMLTVPLDDTMVEIYPNVGDAAINPYVDNPQALLRLADALRPFERPPE
jgi:hypothetical protein